MSRLLDPTESRRGSRSRCFVCGGREAPIRIRVTVEEVTSSGKPIQGKSLSQSVRVCGEHAVALTEKLEELLP